MNAANLIAPTDLRDFLITQGWTLRSEGLADRLYVLEHKAFERRQLAFPMEADAPDYGEAVETVLTKLAELNGKSKAAMLAQAQTINDDVMRFRVFSNANDMTLPLSFAAMLIEGTQRLLKTAACTVLRPRTHHPRLSLNEALLLIEKSRFGHTEPGSFILKVACPIYAMEAQDARGLDGVETPFVRKVTLALHRGLTQLVHAIEADTLPQLIDALKNDPTPLVSSNLCEALAEMHDNGIANALDIDFDWSLLQALPEGYQDRKLIRFQRDYFSRIEAVRRELRAVERHREDNFIGTVERLDGEMGDDGRRSGDVILALLLPEGESIKVKAVLDQAAYAKADQAHMTDGMYVQVSGRLHPGRQPRALTEVTAFELIRGLHDVAAR
jgi:hypothetical protein